MTTIAYKNGILAADTLVTAGNIRVGHTDKVFDTGDYYVAIAGDLNLYDDIIDLINGTNDEEITGHFSAIVVNKFSGEVYTMTEKSGKEIFEAPFYALGSGADIAMGAMAAGASAEEAVRLASEYDITTGGEVTIAHIRTQ